MDEPQSRKLFVGGLIWETSEENLKEHFFKYGQVEDCRIMKDRVTGNARGFGFVTFSDPSVVDQVLLDEHIILGRKVEVKVAKPKGEKTEDKLCRCICGGCCINTHTHETKIFVGGLPPDLTEEEFKEYFGGFGTVVDAVIMYDRSNNRPRGFGFVTFDSEEAVNNVLKQNLHKLHNKVVEVKTAEPRRLDRTYTNDSTGVYFSYDSFNSLALGQPYVFGLGYPYGMNPYGVQAFPPVYNGFGSPAYSPYVNDGALLRGQVSKPMNMKNADVIHGTAGGSKRPVTIRKPLVDCTSSSISNGAENQSEEGCDSSKETTKCEVNIDVNRKHDDGDVAVKARLQFDLKNHMGRIYV